ncbi:MAG: cytochrome P450 [Pseudomonadota bacterium]
MLDTSEHLGALLDNPNSVPLDQIDPSLAELFRQQKHHAVFKRLRAEAPVHFTSDSPFGPFWSITKFKDVVAVDRDHKRFSNAPVITIGDPPEHFQTPMFIAMDPPQHTPQRRTAEGAVTSKQLAALEPLIRSRVEMILDELPRNEEFNWVDRVSREMTMRMLATLFDLPQDDRHLLTLWSDTTTDSPTQGVMDADVEGNIKIMMGALEYFTDLWKRRAAEEPKADFVSLFAHNEATADMIERPFEFLGNLMLLIVGGNDTTRNSASCGVVALNQNPAEYDKLRADPGLIPNMVSEIIRYQTPLSHMRRIAKEDVEIGGKTIREGDKVVLWYCSANRDDEVIDRPYEFLIDRPRARHHLSFGIGIHRCLGNRVAEMQLKILWEEILKRFERIELVGEPVRTLSNFVNGFEEVPVRIPG